MKSKILLFLLAFISFSCLEESEDQTPGVLEGGTYVGTFQRTSPVGDYPSSPVRITVAGHEFNGYSDTHLYPAIGKGTYKVQGEKVIFNNTSVWTANFDWSLILDKEFSLQRDGEWIVLTRRHAEEVTDMYRLKKQTAEVE